MENLTHSGHPNKRECYVGGVPNLSDYREIFGSFHSRAPSIPVLLLPQLDEADLFFDVGYSELFGDSDAADFAPSYEDLFGQPMAFEEARIPAEAEYLSEESDQFIEDPCFSIEHPDQSFQGSKEFSISSNRLNHTGQEQAAPVYSFVVDQTAPLPKIASKSASLSRADSEECRGGLMGVKQFGKVMSRPSHANHGKVALDIHFVPQRGYDTNGSNCKDFVTISKISLQTEPSRLQPPSRPPPLLDVSKGGSSRSTSNCKSTDSAGTGCDTSPSFFDMEVDASSSAAAPATAMKETTRKSLEKSKSAKELMERKGEGFQSGHTKLDSKNSINNKGGNLRKSSAEERCGRASTSSHCCDKIDDTGKRKEATQFFELVKTDKPRKAVMQTNDELIWAQKVKLLKHGKKENEAGIEIYVQQEENAKKTIPVMREYELEEKKLTVAGEAFQTVENNERRKGAKDKYALKEQENKVKIAQEVSEQKARMNVRTAQLHQQTRNKLNVPAKPGKYDYFEDGQQKIEDEQAKQIKENRHTVKRASRRRENEKEAKESYKIEIKQREVLNQEYIDNWVKEAMQQGANVKRIKEAIERDEKKKLKEVCQREDNEKILIEAVQQIKNEKRPQGDPEQEWNETKLKDRELEGKERRLSMTREREENRLKETRDKEENAKRLKEAHEKGKNEKRLKKECERIQTEEGLKETRSRKENEKKLKNACEVEENEKKLKEANEQEGNQKIMKEACEREEHEKRKNEVHQREKNKKRWREAFEQVGSAKEQKEAQKRNDNDKKNSEVEKRVEEFWQRENYTTSLKNDLEQEESEARLEVFVQNEAEKAPKEVTRWKETESLYKGTGERKYLRGLNKVHEQTKKYEKLELPNSTDRGNAYKANRKVKGEPEGSDKNVKTVGMENMVVAERNKASGIFQANSEQKVENPRVENVVELHLLEDNLKKVGETGIGVGKTCINKSRKQAFNQAESKKFLSTVMGKEWVANGGKVEAVRPAVLEIRGNTQKTNNQVNGRQSTIIKDNNLNETCVLEERKTERTERERERELEQQRLQKIEEMERERERERERDRMAVDKATLESCESAHEKAERAAVERVNAGAPQKTLSETHERLEKACAETSDESLQNKASMETRLRMEHTAVERPTTEAREHAVFEAKEGMERSVSDKFSCSSRVGRMRLSSSSSNLQDLNSQSSGSFDGSRNLNFSASGASYDAERYKFVEIESAQRCRARLERHRRTEERAAKALEEKNMRDLLALREQAERHRLAETLDAEVKRWSSGKHGNLRALLSTLQYILGPDSGWQPVPLTEVITNAAVKKAYRKATLCIHPDKLQQRGASIQHKYICEKVYDLLKEAWTKFNSGEL